VIDNGSGTQRGVEVGDPLHWLGEQVPLVRVQIQYACDLAVHFEG
jgi:hypothetical protein